MLPLAVQFLIASVACAINERMARQMEYLLEEVRVLHEADSEATGRKRVLFSDDQRRRLALKGKSLEPHERERCCRLVRPSTILEWFRKLAAAKYDSSDVPRRPGRPRKASRTRELVIQLATENPGWGYTKIRDALRGLKVSISRGTVANVLEETGLEPTPERDRKRACDGTTRARCRE